MPGTLANIGRSCPQLVYLDVRKTLPEAAAGTRGVFFFLFGGWVSAVALEYIDSKLLLCVCMCVCVYVCVCVCVCVS